MTHSGTNSAVWLQVPDLQFMYRRPANPAVSKVCTAWKAAEAFISFDR